MTPYLFIAATAPALTAVGESARRHFRQVRAHAAARTKTERPAGDPTWTYFDVLAILALVIFAAIRYNVGTDFGVYVRVFRTLNVSDWAAAIADSPQEAGYTALMLAIKSFTDNPQVVFLAASILTVVPAYAAIRKVSSRPVLAVALYVLLAFYLAPFNIVRQGIAISLVFYATTCLRHRRVLLVAVCAAAASFHIAAVPALAIMWVAYRWRPTVPGVALILLAALAGVVAIDRVGLIGNLLVRLNARYEGYLYSPDAGAGTYLLIVAHLAFLAYAYILGRHDPEAAAKNDWMMTYVLIGVALMIVGTQALTISRQALFFTIYLMALLPERVAHSRAPRAHSLVLVIMAAAYFLAYVANYGDLIPFQIYTPSPHTY